MKALRNYLDKIKPNFEEGGKFHAFQSVFDGFETFLFVPSTTSKSGTHIHDAIDSKRIMSMVVIALVPALLFGMYNVGYQHFHATGVTGSFIEMFAYGFLAVLPKIIVSYVVGLGIEFVVAQWKKEEIQEGFLVSGILIPMIVPVDCPLWILAVATAFSVIFAKEVFGGTGMNVFNVALVTRAFLFFAYPTKMSGDAVWVSGDTIFGLGQAVDGLTVATPLGAAATSGAVPPFSWDMVTGLIPGSIGETSVIAIALGGGRIFGQGLFRGTQTQSEAASSLPHRHTDFIFSVIGEELGLVGCLLTLALLTAIILRCLYVARHAKTRLEGYACIGVASVIIFQVIINVGMCLFVMPVIGLTLPFISYGGSSLVMLFACMGLVSGVHGRAKPDWLR